MDRGFLQAILPHHQTSEDPGWVGMACEQKLSSLTRYNSMCEGVKVSKA